MGSQKVVPGIRNYAAVDGGMSDNPRPITYQSVYRALVANRMSAPLSETITIAGKHWRIWRYCDSRCRFA